jgi:hypothetical protein
VRTILGFDVRIIFSAYVLIGCAQNDFERSDFSIEIKYISSPLTASFETLKAFKYGSKSSAPFIS